MKETTYMVASLLFFQKKIYNIIFIEKKNIFITQLCETCDINVCNARRLWN